MADASAETRALRPRAMAPRRDAPRREAVPRALLLAMAALVAASLAITSYAKLTDAPLAATPEEGPIVVERIMRIYAGADGAARVLDANGALVADLAPEQGGFISGVARALARVRATHGIPADAPVRLIRYESGRLALKDDATGWRAELIGFGRDNFAAFARLLPAPGAAASPQPSGSSGETL
ncbi:MAG: photosynthetic complex assembly protein PuhC [Pseudomonadota bacterium]